MMHEELFPFAISSKMAEDSQNVAFGKRKRTDRFMNVNEALDMLMDDDWDFDGADIYVEPPSVNEDTDADSGDEDIDGPSSSLNHLSGKQLTAGCSVTLRTRTGRETLIDNNSDSSDSDSDVEPVARKRKPAVTPKNRRAWQSTEFLADKQSDFDFAHTALHELDMTPLKLFELFFDDDVVQYIVDMTNLYAQQKGKHGFQMSVSDFKLCLAVIFISGYNPLPRKRMYWEHSEDVHNEAISSSFPYKKFEEFLRHIHLADNTKLDHSDKMSKIRPLVSMLNERFLQFWPLSENVNVDESMIPYYGRHSAKQFIQNKPIRYGYKIWCLNAPNGYLIQYEPYQGAGTVKMLTDLGMGGSVVIDLLSELPPNPYSVFFDNLFTSLPLLEAFKEKGMHGTGTLRKNRLQNCPLTDVGTMKKRERGSLDYQLDKSSDILLCRWNDNSVVTVASTLYGVTPTRTAKRWSRKESKEIQIDIPNMVYAYNQYMGGTDRMDENIGYYRPSIRINKWWWPLFMAQISFSVHNAWQLYRMSAGAIRRPLDQLGFIRDVAMTLVLANRPIKIAANPGRFRPLDVRVPEDVRFDGKDHHLISGLTQRRCRQCGKKTMKLCMKCPDCPLHQYCSVLFHTK